MNVAAFIFALIGAGLNLFQPVISVPIPGLGLGASMFDIFLFFMNMISARALQDMGFLISLIIFILLISVPAQAVKNGIYALQRNKDKNAVGGFIGCAAVYVIVALIVFLIPQLASSRAEDRFLMQYGLNNVIPFTTPLIWAACYAVAAIFAHTDKSLRIHEPVVGVETPALIKRGKLFLEEGDFEQAERYFEQALRQDPESSQAYLGKLMAKLKVRNTDELVKVSTPLKEQKLFQRALSFANDEDRAKLDECAKINAEIQKERQAKAARRAQLRKAGLSDFQIDQMLASSVGVTKNAQKVTQTEKSDVHDDKKDSQVSDEEQPHENGEQKNNSKTSVIVLILLVGAAIYFGVTYYMDYSATKRAEQARIEAQRAKIEAEKQEEKYRIEALKLQFQGQN